MVLEKGTNVRVHYRGTLADGIQFDSSHDRGEPMTFKIGSGSVISGFDDAVATMSVGDKMSVTIPSDNAYGPHHAEAVQEIPVSKLPEGAEKNDMLTAGTPDGKQLAATIIEIGAETATIDFNHPLAGKDLTFELELVEILAV